MKLSVRKERPVLGKMRFDVTHHEPDLSPGQKAERMRALQAELYAVFYDIEENRNGRMNGKQDGSMV